MTHELQGNPCQRIKFTQKIGNDSRPFGIGCVPFILSYAEDIGDLVRKKKCRFSNRNLVCFGNQTTDAFSVRQRNTTRFCVFLIVLFKFVSGQFQCFLSFRIQLFFPFFWVDSDYALKTTTNKRTCARSVVCSLHGRGISLFIFRLCDLSLFGLRVGSWFWRIAI
jgi:hypothetical protein